MHNDSTRTWPRERDQMPVKVLPPKLGLGMSVNLYSGINPSPTLSLL